MTDDDDDEEDDAVATGNQAPGQQQGGSADDDDGKLINISLLWPVINNLFEQKRRMMTISNQFSMVF